MNVNRNIKWVVALTFVLGYVFSVMAGSESSARSKSASGHQLEPIEEAEAETPDTNWKAVDVENSMPSSFSDCQPNVINRADTLSKVFDILCKSGRPLRILQLGDSHVAGDSYPQAVRERLEAAWGKAESETDTTGVIFSYRGSNGATTKRFATADWMRKIAAESPDLIILSFGTNECHGMGYDEAQHHAQLQEFYDMLTETCPDAVIMMTTPPGDYLTTRRKRRSRSTRANPMNVRCAAELELFGKENGLPVWDLYTIAGGTDAVRNWTSANLMKPDRIHYTPEGYALHGHLLGEAILTAYNQYLNNPS
ncbi:MAG: GDSL-type esterase/lipase family protein [Bacteroidales bacterium]|nr:GDSL-type esterase/lipase family protein [Bacteroidales bacterium]